MPPLVAQPVPPTDVVYPETDGAPIAENTLQYEWIVTIEGNLAAQYADDPNVFVAGDLFWYPVEGDPSTNLAPDAMVVFGRPKGHRRSYKQWEEDGIAPHVVFEIMSQSNRPIDMARKLVAYDRFGVDEYYVFNPEPGRFKLEGYLRQGGALELIEQMNGHVSPKLGVRFDVEGETLRLTHPDGSPFETFAEVIRGRDAAREEAQRAAEDARHATEESRRAAEDARHATEESRRAAEEARRATEESRRAAEEARRATKRAEGATSKLERLESFLREKGIEPPP